MAQAGALVGICSRKGGSGKTTTTHNLGVGIAMRKGPFRVLDETAVITLVDCDPQASLTVWGDKREALGLTKPKIEVEQVLMASTGVEAIKGFQRRLRAVTERSTITVVDCGGYDSMAMRQVLAMASMILVPVNATDHGIGGLQSMLEIIQTAIGMNPGLVSLVFGSAVPPQKGSQLKGALDSVLEDSGEIFQELGMEDSGVMVTHRNAYAMSGDGRSIWEMRDPAAHREMTGLLNAVGKGLFQ